MGVVALDAVEARAFGARLHPRACGAPMGVVEPIAVARTVTLLAQFRGRIGGNGRSVPIDEDEPVVLAVAVKAPVVAAVGQRDALGVLGDQARVALGCARGAVALAARVSAFAQAQAHGVQLAAHGADDGGRGGVGDAWSVSAAKIIAPMRHAGTAQARDRGVGSRMGPRDAPLTYNVSGAERCDRRT